MSSKTKLLKAARLAGTVLLLAYVLYKADLFSAAGWIRLAGTFAHVSVTLVVISILSNLVLDVISAAKWWVLARAVDLRGGPLTLFGYYLSGRFFNLVLPSNIGGDVIRVGLQGRLSGNTAASAASVFMDRLTGFIVLISLTTADTLLNARTQNLPFVTEALVLSVLGLAGLLWVIFDRRPFEFVRRISLRLVPRLEPLFHQSDKVLSALNLYRSRRAHLAGAFLLSLLFYVSAGVTYWLDVAPFAPETPLLPVLIATPFIMFIMNIPLSLGNVGLMEFAYTVVLGLFGVPPSVALSAAVLHRLKSFIAAGWGGIVYNMMKLESPVAELKSLELQAEKS
jgi:uncharacterized protein (TIRG00374 family)